MKKHMLRVLRKRREGAKRVKSLAEVYIEAYCGLSLRTLATPMYPPESLKGMVSDLISKLEKGNSNIPERTFIKNDEKHQDNVRRKR